MQAGEKKIGDNVVIYAEPGLLTITIKPEIGVFKWLTISAVMVILVFSVLFSIIVIRGPDFSRHFLLYLGMILICVGFCSISVDAFLVEEIRVCNGVLVNSFGPFGRAWSTKNYQVASITNLRVLIPPDCFRRPREYYIGWGHPAVRGTLGFDYENKRTVDLAHKIDRLTATYLFKELQDHGSLSV